MGSRLQKGRLSALDTETIGGYAVILSTEHESWYAHSFETCVQPIFKQINKGKISGRILMWNQGYDSQAVLKYLPEKNVNEILDDNTTTYNDRYEIVFIKGKVLKIRDRKYHKTMSGYDIAQFFNYMHLGDAGEKYVGEGKYESDLTKEITTGSYKYSDDALFWMFAHNLDEVKHYCHKDALLTQKLGYYLSDVIQNLYGFRLSTYSAKTAIGKRLIKDTVGTYINKKGKTSKAYPRYNEDSGAGRDALACYHGGIFDCKKRGSFGECTDVDISSAYPYHMRNLPNWSNGDFIQVSPNEIEKNDYYGWLWARFDYPLIPYTSHLMNYWDEVHDADTIKVGAVNPRKFYPNGSRWQLITLVEYKFLKKHGYASDVGSGYVWRHDTTKYQHPDPFTWIDDVYQKKQEIKASEGKTYKYSLTKIPMNSGYGTTAQKKGYAEYRNMFYSSYITASTRIQISELLEEIGYDSYISIATDGVLIEGDVRVPNKFIFKGLGSWDVNRWDEALVLANGIYRLEREHDDPDEKIKQALRGMLSYKGDLKEALIKYKDKSEFAPATKARPVTMYQGMKWGRYTKDSINRFVKTGRKLSCNTDTTKKWGKISCFEDLLNGSFIGDRYTVDEMDNLKS